MWHKADLHMHTTYSDGLMSPAEVVDIVHEQTDLKVIAITDHDTAAGAFEAREYAQRHYPELEVIIGQELTTGQGDVLGLFLQSTLPAFRTAAGAIEAIHEQGGLAIAAHPFTFGFGTESVNFAILREPFDAVEIRNGCPWCIPGNLFTTLLNRFKAKRPAVACSDSHIPYSVGQAFTWFPGSTAEDLRQAIQTNKIRPAGTTWTLLTLLRLAAVITERGWPSYPVRPQLVGE